MTTTWFVYTNCAETNRRLANLQSAAEQGEMLCADGKRRNLWQLSDIDTGTVMREHKVFVRATIYYSVGDERPKPYVQERRVRSIEARARELAARKK